jgi:hypothetical protein
MTIGPGFWEQPFRSAITAFAKAAAIPYYKRRLRRFEALLGRAHSVQHTRLFEKIRRCADSRFGREHGFSQITTLDDFRQRVPISPYEYLAPYITDVTEGRVDALFPSHDRVLAFACTTGTTGKPKLNPVTQSWLREYLRAWEVWGVKSIVEHSEMIGTKVLQLTGPGDLDRSPSGLSIGMVSSIASKFQNPIYRSFYAIPPEVADIGDSVAKYYTTQRLAMASTVGFIVAITPANLIRLAEIGHTHRERLIRDIHDGTLCRELEVPSALRQKLARFIGVKRPERARVLERIAERTGTLYPKDYWPLSLIACWLGGTIGYQSRDLPRYYGNVATRDLGLVSTEGRHTIPLHDRQPEGVLAVDGSFYEFIPAEERGSPGARALEGHELRPGDEYYLIMTTSSGLYRYDIGDVVRCQGFVGQAPVLEFLHKEGQCADMEGEKISGHQIAQAVGVASRELGLSIDYFTATPVRRDGQVPYYALLIERALIEDIPTARQFIQIVDRELIRQNVMYAGKRNDLYIDWPQLVRLAPGTWSDYMATETGRSGTGDSQYKHPALVPETSWLDRFGPLDTITVEGGGRSASAFCPIQG